MSKLIGKQVEIIAEDNIYFGFKGKIIHYDGKYHISGGNFDYDPNGSAPVFSRDEFKVIDSKYYRVYIDRYFLTIKAA